MSLEKPLFYFNTIVLFTQQGNLSLLNLQKIKFIEFTIVYDLALTGRDFGLALSKKAFTFNVCNATIPHFYIKSN